MNVARKAYELAYAHDPEKLAFFRELDDYNAQADLALFLHERGYTFFSMGGLTMNEVVLLLRGAVRRKEFDQKAMKNG